MLSLTTRAARPLRRQVATISSQSYTDRMKATGRPVSPHVTTYAFPIVALSSITQRVTGVGLSVGIGAMAVASLAGADVGGIATILGASSLAPAVKFVVAFPLTYHFLGAVRHAAWDKYPEMLQNKSAEQASWALIGGSAVVSLGLAALTFDKPVETKK
ncbi:succinate dehydrogenase/Fumarate reductase transmembrane subunit-domain-containing protein [Pelagophyceae sp. CCMP2097]|nr:succinate dehydrogenase/Fumarate reductase transmembrane subunit-domain-containing protein [Pelagophyceae sp. CCMP2097]